MLGLVADHGFARLDASGKFTMSSESMLAGMTALAKRLAQSVLRGNLSAVADFANEYCPHLNLPAVERITSLLGRSVHTLDYVQPIYQYQESSTA